MSREREWGRVGWREGEGDYVCFVRETDRGGKKGCRKREGEKQREHEYIMSCRGGGGGGGEWRGGREKGEEKEACLTASRYRQAFSEDRTPRQLSHVNHPCNGHSIDPASLLFNTLNTTLTGKGWGGGGVGDCRNEREGWGDDCRNKEEREGGERERV